MAHHVQDAAALEARRQAFVGEPHRHVDADAGAGADALEIDVDGLVLDGVDLDLARDDAGFLAVDIEIDDGRQELAATDEDGELPAVERNVLGLLGVAVDDAGHPALAPHRAGAAGAGMGARGRLDLVDLLGHGAVS